MAVKTFRYKWQSVDVPELNSQLPPSCPVLTIDGPLPSSFMDITIDELGKVDLDELMLTNGWIFQSEVVSGSLRGIIVKQSISAQLTIDESTSSVLFSTLLSVNVNTDVGFLEILASLATSAQSFEGFAKIFVDGVPIDDGGSGHLIGLATHTIVKRMPIAAGPHTIDIRWRTGPFGTLHCRPFSAPDQEHATLLVRETT